MTLQPPLSKPLALACHATRIGAAVWLLWSLVRLSSIWADPVLVTRNYQRLAGHALEPMSAAQHLGSYLVILPAWASAAVIGYFVWQLFGRYLAGRIFTADAVASLRALGWAALASVIVDLSARPVVFAIVSNGGVRFWAEPNDLLHAGMAMLIIVLSAVFAQGVAIADEHEQFV